MRWTWIGLIVLSAALAGCAQEEATYELRGTFTEEASDADMAELEAEITDRGGRMDRLESFPVQFHASELGPTDCEEVRTFAQEADYVRDVGECQLDVDEDGGDEPTRNES